MPKWDSIVHIPGYKVLDVEGLNPVFVSVLYIGSVACPRCLGLNLRIKDSFIRVIRHESIGWRACFLRIQCHKYLCKGCGRYFRPVYPGIGKYQRCSAPFQKEICQKHHQGMSLQTIHRSHGVSWATIERWYHAFLRLKETRIKHNPAPRVLGIDEHFFTKKKGYATTLCDLSRNRIHDITLGRSEQSLCGYLARLTAKDRTQVVVMDLSPTYRRIAQTHFPNAKIVTDRFHVVRLINQAFLETWKHFDPVGRKNRGLLSLMRRHQHRLSPKQQQSLSAYLQTYPGLEPIYDFKQHLTKLMLMKKQTAKQCKTLIPRFLSMIQKLKKIPIDSLQRLGKTLDAWKEEIARMWRFSKSNAITEGFHRKMKLIQRNAYGFKNFNNYRLRVRALCG